MSTTIPNVEHLTPAQRVKLVAELRAKAQQHEQEAEAAQRAAEAAKLARNTHCDRAYHLRRMAHAVEQLNAPTTTAA